MTTSTVDHLTKRLLDWYETQSWAAELEALTPVVLTELARGEPVDAARIAARAGMPAPTSSTSSARHRPHRSGRPRIPKRASSPSLTGSRSRVGCSRAGSG